MDLKRKRVGGYRKVTSGSGQQLIVGYGKHGRLLLSAKMSTISELTE